MSPRRVATLAVCIVLAGVLSCAKARAEMVDRIVANVNGEIILYSELRQQIKVLEKNMPMLSVTDPAKKAQVEHDVLTQMIRQKLADMEAERLKVTVTSSEVDVRVQQILEQSHSSMAQLEVNLKANGQTLDKFRTQIKKDMERERLVERVCNSKVLISDKQVEAFLSGERGEAASTSQKVHLGLIVLPVGDKYGKPEEAEKTGREILDKLKGGADFRSLAKQYSKGPAAQEGGMSDTWRAMNSHPLSGKGSAILERTRFPDWCKGLADITSLSYLISTARRSVRQTRLCTKRFEKICTSRK